MENCRDLTAKGSNRWDYIDFIETLAILFVLIYHCTTYNYSFLDNHNLPIFYVRYYLQTILSTCVPMFFFANGYLLLSKSFDLKKHILKSLKIVVLTFLWGMITVVCISLIENIQLSLSQLLKYVWTWKQDWVNHFWYMGALICIYIFFPLLKKVFDSHFKIFLYFTVVTAIFTFGNTLINHIGSVLLNSLRVSQTVYTSNWFNIFNPFRGIRGYAFVYFCMGGLAYHYKDKILAIEIRKRNLLSLCSILISCTLLFVLGFVFSKSSGKMFDIVWNGYDTIPTAINVISIYVLSLNYKKQINTFKFISCNTLGIYFIHEILIHLLKPIVIKSTFFCTFTGNILFSVSILGMSLLCAFIVKKIPLMKNLVKI